MRNFWMVNGSIFLYGGRLVARSLPVYMIRRVLDFQKSATVRAMTKYKAIFWDNDGVLVDTEKFYMQAAQEIFKSMGEGMTHEEYCTKNLGQGFDIVDQLKAFGLSGEVLTAKRKEISTRYEDLLVHAEMISGVDTVLRELHGHFKMGVVTSTARHQFFMVHDRLDLQQYFDFVLTYTEIGVKKPDPKPYLAALDLVSFSPAECLAVEDSVKGLRAAKAAGIDCAVIPTDMSRGLDFSSADYVLDSVKDLQRLLMSQI